MAPNVEERLTHLETMEEVRKEDLQEIKADLKALPGKIEIAVERGVTKCREYQDLRNRNKIDQDSGGFTFKKIGAVSAGSAAVVYGMFEFILWIGKLKNWF